MNPGMEVEPNLVIEAQAREIAQLVHRAILAESAVEQLQRQNVALTKMMSESQEQTTD